MPRYIFIALLVVGALFGMVWAVHPILYPPQGLMPYDWTYVQLIQDRYPFHLVAPKWVSDEFHWMFAEASARLGAILIGVACSLVFIRLRRHEKPAA
jgi:hypothetical protein